MKLYSINELNKIGVNGNNWKIIYFEYKKNMKSAGLRENKLKSLTRNKILELIRKSNPELLDLKHAIANQTMQSSRNFLEELNY